MTCYHNSVGFCCLSSCCNLVNHLYDFLVFYPFLHFRLPSFFVFFGAPIRKFIATGSEQSVPQFFTQLGISKFIKLMPVGSGTSKIFPISMLPPFVDKNNVISMFNLWRILLLVYQGQQFFPINKITPANVFKWCESITKYEKGLLNCSPFIHSFLIALPPKFTRAIEVVILLFGRSGYPFQMPNVVLRERRGG